MTYKEGTRIKLLIGNDSYENMEAGTIFVITSVNGGEYSIRREDGKPLEYGSGWQVRYIEDSRYFSQVEEKISNWKERMKGVTSK